MSTPLRIGVLGATRIAPAALLAPARANPGSVVTAVAARSVARASAYAAEHGIPRVLDDYAAVIADPDVDAVYNPLPNSEHGRWTIAALRAGKHVLCEKPFTANAAEALTVAQVAAERGLIAMEAFHYRYHPLMARLLDVVGSGRLGRITSMDAWFRVRIADRSDIRWDLALAGGSLMDIGCYPLHALRTLAGTEPEVLSAVAVTRSPGVDRTVRAELGFGEVRATLSSSMLARRPGGSSVRVQGTHGCAVATGFVLPHQGNRLEVVTRMGRRAGSIAPKVTSYAGQLTAFLDAVGSGVAPATGGADAVAQMRAIDALYLAAGLPARAAAERSDPQSTLATSLR